MRTNFALITGTKRVCWEKGRARVLLLVLLIRRRMEKEQPDLRMLRI